MLAFSNKRLRDEGNDKGRNLQVMQKGREQEYLKRHEEMPLSRNEKRQLGNGSKATKQIVARAARRGQLVSRSQAQLTKRVCKIHSELEKAVALFQERRALHALTAGLKSPAPNNQASNAPAGSGSLEAGKVPGAAALGAAGAHDNVGAAATGAAEDMGRGAAGAQESASADALSPAGRGAGRGRGAAPEVVAAAAARGRGAAGRARGGRGGRGRRGRGRSEPASAQDM
jgi:hypothetical protein